MKHCDVNMYADDTSLMFASDSVTHINDCVNDDLNNLKSWLQGNKLSLNVAKTHSLVVGSRKRLKDINDDRVAKPSFVVGEANVSIVENIKYLGLIVDKHLSWDEQISAVTKKVSRGLGMLRFSKKYLPIVTVQKMYREVWWNHTSDTAARYGELPASMLSIGCKNSKIGQQESSQTVLMMLLPYP